MTTRQLDQSEIGRLGAMRLDAGTDASSGFAPETWDETTRTLEVVFSAGSIIRRQRWDGPYDMKVSMDPAAARLGRLNAGAPLLDSHQSFSIGDVIGAVVPGTARIESGLAKARVKLSDVAGDADRTAKIARGFVRGISMGFDVLSAEEVDRSAEGKVPLVVVTQWEPFEVSACWSGADAGALTQSKQSGETPKEFNRMDPTKVNEAKPADGGAKPVDHADVARNERERVLGITKLGARHGCEQLAAACIADPDCTLEQAGAKILEEIAKRADAGAIGGHVRMGATESEHDAAAIEGHMLSLLDAKHERSNGSERFAGMSLVEIARHQLSRRGVVVKGMGDREVARLALGHRFQDSAGMTRSDLPAIFANVATKRLRKAYNETPKTYEPFVGVLQVPDFKQANIALLSAFPSLQAKDERGEYRTAALSDNKEVIQASTYGVVVRITREMIVDDDLGALDRLASMAGVAAARTRNALVWTAFCANPTLLQHSAAVFSATSVNVGTNGNPDITKINELKNKLFNQTGLAGEKLRLPVAGWVAGTSMADALDGLINPQVYLPSASTSVATAGARGRPVIQEPLIDDSASPDAWYCFADPRSVDGLMTCELTGGGLRTEWESSIHDYMALRVADDFGVAWVDYRGWAANLNP